MKPNAGTEDTLWEEVAAVKNSVPATPDLPRYVLQSEFPAAPDLSGKANVGASYTKVEADRREAVSDAS